MQQDPIIIIGSGMAGYSLARELRKLNTELAITLICRDNGDSYSKPTLSNAFAQAKSAESLAIATSEAMAQSLNIKVMNFYQVSDINTEQQTVTVHPVLASDKQQILAYAKLVIAAGASPRLLPNVPVDNQRIFAINHLDDYKHFQQKIQTLVAESLVAESDAQVNIAIIGAGLIGCEFANDLISQQFASESQDDKMTISVFDNAKVPMANQLPSQAGQALQQALEQGGVKFELGVAIQSIVNQDNKVAITLTNGSGETEVKLVDIVLVAIGLVANTSLAEHAGLQVAHLSDNFATNTHLPRTAKQGILVNEFLQTSNPHIYAIGDCANVAGSFMPYVMPLMNQAKALAKTLADSTQAPTAVSYPAMPVAIKTPSLPIVVLPVSAQYPPEQVDWQTTPTADGMVMSAFAKDNTDKLLGFVLVGKEAGKQRMTLSKQVDNWL